MDPDPRTARQRRAAAFVVRFLQELAAEIERGNVTSVSGHRPRGVGLRTNGGAKRLIECADDDHRPGWRASDLWRGVAPAFMLQFERTLGKIWGRRFAAPRPFNDSGLSIQREDFALQAGRRSCPYLWASDRRSAQVTGRQPTRADCRRPWDRRRPARGFASCETWRAECLVHCRGTPAGPKQLAVAPAIGPQFEIADAPVTP